MTRGGSGHVGSLCPRSVPPPRAPDLSSYQRRPEPDSSTYLSPIPHPPLLPTNEGRQCPPLTYYYSPPTYHDQDADIPTRILPTYPPGTPTHIPTYTCPLPIPTHMPTSEGTYYLPSYLPTYLLLPTADACPTYLPLEPEQCLEPSLCALNASIGRPYGGDSEALLGTYPGRSTQAFLHRFGKTLPKIFVVGAGR